MTAADRDRLLAHEQDFKNREAELERERSRQEIDLKVVD
jgi:hypothetical protein